MKLRDVINEGWYEDGLDGPEPERVNDPKDPHYRRALTHQLEMADVELRAYKNHPRIDHISDPMNGGFAYHFLQEHPDFVAIPWKHVGYETTFMVPKDETAAIKRITKLTKKHWALTATLYEFGGID